MCNQYKMNVWQDLIEISDSVSTTCFVVSEAHSIVYKSGFIQKHEKIIYFLTLMKSQVDVRLY